MGQVAGLTSGAEAQREKPRRPMISIEGHQSVSPVLSFPLADEILASYSAELGSDFSAYRNHVCRELNFFLALSGLPSLPTAVLVAAAFHDLGIWTHDTFDYLPPSIELARAYLAKAGLQALDAEVGIIINEHHKLLPYRGPFSANAEAFRKADLMDLSLGLVRFGQPRSLIHSVQAALPNAGFHRRLGALGLRHLARSPLRPLPMVHW